MKKVVVNLILSSTIMNRKYKILITFAILSLSGCIEEFGGTGEPFNRHDQVTGSWTVTRVVQRDLLTENPLYQTVEITDLFDFDQYNLTLNADGSFAVFNTGDAPGFIITGGTWAFDSEEFPAAIILTSQNASSVLDFGSLNSLTESRQLNVKYVQSVIIPKEDAGGNADKEEASVAYEYTLSKVN
jgi:hypothetical protein